MKIYTLLLATTVSSVFWSAAADKGSLRGFGTRIARALDGFLADEGTTQSWKITLDGDDGDATTADNMEWAEELMTCLEFTATSLTFSQTEDLASDQGSRRLGCDRRCQKKVSCRLRSRWNSQSLEKRWR